MHKISKSLATINSFPLNFFANLFQLPFSSVYGRILLFIRALCPWLSLSLYHKESKRSNSHPFLKSYKNSRENGGKHEKREKKVVRYTYRVVHPSSNNRRLCSINLFLLYCYEGGRIYMSLRAGDIYCNRGKGRYKEGAKK